MNGRANGALLACVFAVACSRADKKPAPVPAEQVRQCIRVLETKAEARPSMRAFLLAERCPFACPALADLVRADASEKLAYADQCGLFCSSEARQRFESADGPGRWAALAKACGNDYFGLPPGAEHLMSLEWFVLQRVGKWLATAESSTDDDGLRAALRAARESFEVPLAYSPERLPTAERVARSEENRRFVRIAEQGTAAGSFPVARFSERGTVVATTPAQGGALVLLGDPRLPAIRLAETVQEHAGERMVLGVAGFPVLLHEVALRPASDAGEAPQIPVDADLDAASSTLLSAVSDFSVSELELRVGSGVTVQDVAALLDTSAEHGVRAVGLSKQDAAQ